MQCIDMYAAACIRSYLKSVLRNKFLIFDAYHPGTLYLREHIWGSVVIFWSHKGRDFGFHKCGEFLD